MTVKNHNILIFILALGTFGILNTEMGIIGILPLIAENFNVEITDAGMLVSLFALIVALSGIVMPLLFSSFNRRKVMLGVLVVFSVCNLTAVFAPNFAVLLAARLIPAFFHTIYCSLAYAVAASLVDKKEVPQAISKVMIGVSAGIVIGIPLTSFIADTFSYRAAMMFFAVMNSITLVLTFFIMPSMPVKEKLSYGSQLSVLKKSITWLSLLTVSSIGAAVFAVYAYIAQYLKEIGNIHGDNLSMMLFLFGTASILGNFMAGKLLSKNPLKTVLIYPVLFSIMYIMLFLFGKITAAIILIVFLWGMFNGIGNNIQQYWIMSAVPKAPDFANGLFISFGHLGTTAGTFAGGMILADVGIHYTVFGGVIFLFLTLISVFLRSIVYEKQTRLNLNQG